MAIVSTTSSSVQGIKCVSVHDIPKLQLWLDASDSNTVSTVPFFTDWSWYFNGSSQVVVPHNSNLVLGSNDFTIEFWCFFNNTPYGTLCSKRPSTAGNAGGYAGVVIGAYSSGFSLYITTNGSTWGIGASISTVDIGAWQHVAVTRNGNTITFYKNGINVYSVGITGSIFDNGANLTIGADSMEPAVFSTGYLSNFRIINGRALYTENFSNNLPTAPLPLNVPNTVLHTLTRNGTLQDYSLSPATITTYGSPAATDPSMLQVFNQWSDKSPNQISLTQTVYSKKPFYKTQEINGLNVVVFDGSDDFLNLSQSIPISNAHWSHFFVYKRPSNGTYNVSIGNGNASEASNAFLHWSENRIYSGDRYTNSSVLSTGVNVGAVSKNELMFLNNTKLPYVAGWGPNTNASTLGRYSISYYHDDAICEVIHTNAKLPEYELRLISNRLIAKWKIPTTTPFVTINPIISVSSASSLATTNGSWAMEPDSYSIQWQNSIDNSNWNDIPSQTLSTFIVNNVYENQYIRSKTTATNVVGTSNAAYSNVLQLTTVNVVAPVISWVASNSSSITTTNGNWTTTMPITSTTYQWLSSTNGTAWFSTPFTTSTSNFIDCSNTFIKSVVTVKTRVSVKFAESNIINTGDVQSRVLVLRLDGTVDGGNTRFVDSSNSNFIVNRNGVTQSTTSPTAGGYSMYFNGSVSLAIGSSVFTGGSDFTAEADVYNLQSTGRVNGIFGTQAGGGNGWCLLYYNNNWSIEWGGSAWSITTQPLPANTWWNVALQKSGSNLSLFINGQRFSLVNGVGGQSNTDFRIGRIPYGYVALGYITNVKFFKAAKYSI